ncbi:MAG: TIGR02281 family clan AA aspartic protease [Gammaproteobacteria bacterium]|jgi:aspartyl protease family protein|nr:TIGR02281 family clan AA aspartic protease [Gammaproteobacteria bacterium]
MSLSRFLLYLLVFGTSLHQIPVLAGMDVRVVGLFTDRAVLLVEGQQRLLKVGQSSPEGIRLVSASSDLATLLIDGEQVTARLDGRVSASKRPAAGQEVQVWRNTTGMYTTVGSINGLPVSFLVDTGATQVVMNASQARRLGVDFHVIGTPSEVTTASGVEPAWMVKLDSVKVGELEVRNVSAVVMEGTLPAVTLLGMSYLGRMTITNDGHLMTLRKKY